MLLFLFFGFLTLIQSLTTEVHNSGVSSSEILGALDALPKDCHKNGKTYKKGEEFEIGHLRYKCQDYGVYSMEGCTMKDGKPLKLGESVVQDNIKYQCLSHGSSVFYRETTCGIMGQPDCDKIPLPKGFEEATKKTSTEPVGATKIGDVQLPKGWQVVDGGSKKINGTNSQVITHVFMFNPVHQENRIRARRQSGHGIGTVLGVEEVGAEPGRPMMPMGMLMENSRKIAANHKKSGTTSEHQKSMLSQSKHESEPSSKIVSTQTVGATLKTGDKNDHDLTDLNGRTDPKKTDIAHLKPGTVSGQKSAVNWQGRKIIVNGKTVGTGEGTFTFGNSPTAAH